MIIAIYFTCAMFYRAFPNKKCAQYFSGFQAPSFKPVVVLPVDAASLEAMGEQIKKAWIDADESQHMDDMVKITLAAIGIKGGAK